MKYFFLAEGWVIGRVWELGGLWDRTAWRRAPHIERLDICLWEEEELLWLHQLEEGIAMVEVKPASAQNSRNIGQVVIKRLIDSDRVIEILHKSGNYNLARSDRLDPS